MRNPQNLTFPKKQDIFVPYPQMFLPISTAELPKLKFLLYLNTLLTL